MQRNRQLIFGILLGAWISFFLLTYMIGQEFNPAWSNSPVGYKQLHDEIQDLLFLFPLVFLGPVTIISGILLYIKKQNSKA